LRIEHEHVFETTHRLLGQLIREGKVHAVRIDRPTACSIRQSIHHAAAPGREIVGLEAEEKDNGVINRPLRRRGENPSGGERLPSRWAIHGATGYSFLNDLNGVFVDSSQARRMRRSTPAHRSHRSV
jgi:(1->4)-alpha-D-glucan 1-alpha-D-glucosylmutase